MAISQENLVQRCSSNESVLAMLGGKIDLDTLSKNKAQARADQEAVDQQRRKQETNAVIEQENGELGNFQIDNPILMTSETNQMPMWSDRPLEFAKAVNSAFNDISTEGMEIFGHNGSLVTGGGYGIAGVNNIDLIANMLKTYSDQGKTHFTFMDIGAGLHGCADNITKYINKNRALFPNIQHVEIISLSGSDTPSSQETQGICRISKITRFKIEEIGRWLHPSDALIQAYEKLELGSRICAKLLKNMKAIQAWTERYELFIIEKILQDDEVLTELSSFEMPNEAHRKRANSQLEQAITEFRKLSEEYESSRSDFKRHYDIDIDIYKKVSVEDEVPPALQEVVPNENVKNLLENINKNSAIVSDSDLQSKFGIMAHRELETLRTIKAMNLPDHVDYATSSWCFKHLVDPADTLIKTYNLLTPKTGIFHGDGFYLDITYGDTDISSSNYDLAMLTFLNNLNVPYILDQDDTDASTRIGGFIIARTSQEQMKPNFKYKSMTQHGSSGKSEDIESYSGIIMRIEADESWEILSNYSYKPSPYEDRAVQLGGTDFVAKYRGRLGHGRKGVCMRSAETALLLGKLRHEGISVGMGKIPNDQYEDLFEFIAEEYPDMPYAGTDLEDMQKMYVLYDTVKNGNLQALISLLEQDPLNQKNRNMLLVAAKNDRDAQFMWLLNFLNNKGVTTESELKLIELIKIEAFELACAADAAKIFQLFESGQVKVEFDAKTAWDLIHKIHSNYSPRKIENQAIEYIIRNVKGDKKTLWELALSSSSEELSKKIQTCLNITLSDQDLAFLIQDRYAGETIRQVLDAEFATTAQLIAINDIQKIRLLTSKASIDLFRRGIVDFEKFSTIDSNKISILMYRAAGLCEQRITTFDKLVELDIDRLEELTGGNAISLCGKAGITTFEKLAKMDLEKLKFIMKRYLDIMTLVQKYQITFDSLMELDIDILKKCLGDKTFYELELNGTEAEVLETVARVRSGIIELESSNLTKSENLNFGVLEVSCSSVQNPQLRMPDSGSLLFMAENHGTEFVRVGTIPTSGSLGSCSSSSSASNTNQASPVTMHLSTASQTTAASTNRVTGKTFRHTT